MVTSLALAMVVAAAPPIQLWRLPGGEDLTAARSLADEAALAKMGAVAAVQAKRLPAAELELMQADLAAAYAELLAERGRVPTPVTQTIAGAQRPDGFDLLVVPPRAKESDRAVLFLHGWGGSFTLQCWLTARAVADEGWMTVCPATGVAAVWSDAAGEKIVRETLRWLRAHGKKRVVLAGLSNGGSGAARLARKLEAEFEGAICLSGVAGEGPARLPMLVIHGTGDTMFGVDNAHRFTKGRPERTLKLLPGGHFVLLRRRDEVGALIRRWIAELPVAPR
ncbi:MAG: alpha/beta hydrolase [Myxococcaceae bacterium]